ncbi:MAG: nif-specific transcriptional activator NifA [Desulfobulbaceae bacterium]|nr:nif-specific transcriptional activator NifA [Desulfobulbaceae bacterium]
MAVARIKEGRAGGKACRGEGATILALELQALSEIAQLIGSAVDLDATLAEILRILHASLRMERGTLVLLDDSGRRLVIRASCGLTPDEAARGVYSVEEGVIGRIFSSGSPGVVPDVHSEPLFLNRTGARKPIAKERISFIGVPVLLNKKPVGVLSVDRLFGPETSFEEDVRFLTVLATFIAQFLQLQRSIDRKEAVLREENLSLKAELQSRYSYRNIIGQSKAMQEVFRAIDKVAPSRATALILGESGTGKELVARAIHQASRRQERPFIKINCAALPETLLESELLGHEKGAFTGATAAKKGRFELADGGTLFLDEIGELPLNLQAKLLRVLQEQQFERLGGVQTIKVDVRVIAATNRSLESAVHEGSFRVDLYYRLNVVPILLPSLVDRREDVVLLLDYFLAASNRRNHRQVRLSREVLDFLKEYDWPGNVRELQNLVERLVIMTDKDGVTMADLPTYLVAEPEGVSAVTVQQTPVAQPLPAGGRSLREMERERLVEALGRHGWVQTRAARELGITMRQIGYRIKKYGLAPPWNV